jgi:hypothetical protein
MHFVFPGMCGLEYSQERIAKKKAPMTTSATTAGAVSRMDGWCEASKSFLSSQGVTAFCRRVGGSTFSKALKRALTEGCRFWLFGM